MTSTVTSESKPELQLTRPLTGGEETILTKEALAFLADLADKFTPELTELLLARQSRQAEFDQGAVPGFIRRQTLFDKATGK